MLGLMQIINYMFKIGYDETEISLVFNNIKTEEDLTVLLDELGIELGNEVIFKSTFEKLDKYPSALSVTKMRLELI
jgi:hypothetical protein